MERSVDSIDLFSPVTALKGVGPARARQLEKLGIFTLYDLIAFFPRGYEDRTKRVAIAALEPGCARLLRGHGHLPAHDGLHPPGHGADARARRG